MCRNYMEDHPDFASECSAFFANCAKRMLFCTACKMICVPYSIMTISRIWGGELCARGIRWVIVM